MDGGHDAFAAVHNANNIAQLDAAISQGVGKPIAEGVQAGGDAIVAAFDKFMTATTHAMGEGINNAVSKGSHVITEKTQHVATQLSGEKAIAKDSQTPQKEVGTPDLQVSKDMATQISGLKWPPDVTGQTPVHIEAANVAEMAANSSKQMSTISTAVQTQSQGLGV